MKVTSVEVGSGGNGYTSAPSVSFEGGGGTGASGTAEISGGKVASVSVSNGGANYKSAPSVRFSGGGGTGASASASVDD